jgi:hypothetical protein
MGVGGDLGSHEYCFLWFVVLLAPDGDGSAMTAVLRAELLVEQTCA